MSSTGSDSQLASGGDATSLLESQQLSLLAAQLAELQAEHFAQVRVHIGGWSARCIAHGRMGAWKPGGVYADLTSLQRCMLR